MKTNRKALILAVALLCAVIVATAAFSYSGLARVLRDPEAFYAEVRTLGAWGPALIVGLQILQVLFGPVPGQVVSMAAGYLYGVAWGTLVSITGLGMGSWLAMWLARRLGRPLVLRLADPKTVARLDGLSQRHGLWLFFLVFLLPFLPTDVGCFVAGLTPLPIASLLVLAIVGRLPGVVILNWLGATSQALGPSALAAIAAVTVVGALVMVRYRDRLQEAMFSFMRWLGVG